MKTSLDHLPEDKRDKLAAMVDAIRELPEVGMIILFGSHARGTWVRDVETGYVSDYDLLVLVDDPKVEASAAKWRELEEKISAFAKPHWVQMLVEDFREVNAEVRRGQFFWAEIVTQGIELFNKRRFMVATPKTRNPEEHKALSQEYFDNWFASAGVFFETYQFTLGKGHYNNSAFQLHQAAERYLAAVLLVFTGTKPLLHDLESLSQMVSPLHPLLAEPFPMATPEDERLFKLLRKAYIDARYKKNYRITAEELGTLGERVKDLSVRVEQACREQIASIA